MADETVKVLIDGDASGAVNAANQARDGIGSALDDIKEKFQTAFEIVGLAAAYEGIKQLGEALDEAALSAVKIRNVSEILGVNREALEGMHAAAEEAGVGADRFDSALEMLAMRMQQARDGSQQMQDKLAAVGISLKDLSDPAFTVDKAAQAIAESHATAAEKLDVVGRRGVALLEVMQQLGTGEDAAADKARSLGAITDQQAANLVAYHAAIADVTTRWDNFKSVILSAVAPATGALATGLLNVATAGKQIDAGTLAADTRAVAAEFLRWATAAKDLYADLTHIFSTIGTSLGNVGAVFAAAAHGDFSRAKEIWKEGTADLAEIDKEHDDQILANHKALADAIAAVDSSRNAAIKPPPAPSANPLDVVVPFDKMTRESAKWAEMEIRDADQVLDAMRKTAEGGMEADEASKLGQLEASEKLLSQELRDGEISAAQFLKQEKELIQKKLDAELSYLQQKRALEEAAGRDTSAIDVAIAKAHADALKQEQTADNQAHQAALAQWKQLGSRIETSFASNITAMIEGTKSFGSALRSILSSAIDGVIQMFVKMGVQWAENMITQELVGKTTAVSQISANAGVAATAAMASVAAIPFYGWAAAPGVGAATFAEAISYEGAAAAAQGFDVPQGVSPLTRLHEKEMVLPASLADGVRAMTQGGNRGRTTVNFPGQRQGGYFITSMDDLKNGINALIRSRGGPAVAF